MEAAEERTDSDAERLSYKRYWMALYRRDVARAERIVELCLKQWKPERIYLRLFEPALNFSGKMWAAGCISHQDEHFVTYHTVRLIRRVRRKFVPAETSGPLAMATSSAQESHVIGLRMVCDFLQSENWRIHWLPSNDRATLRQAAGRLRPQAMLISIGLDIGLAPARRMIGELRGSGYEGLVVVGGAAIHRDTTRVQALGADLTAPNGAMLVRQLRLRRGSLPGPL
jgi:methanogenic corrinoid protein MtbC1